MNDIELEKARNYVRLNSKNLTDIHKLLVEVNVELFGLVFDIPDLKQGQYNLINIKTGCFRYPIGIDYNEIENSVGWSLSNSKGTIRTKDGKIPTKKHIRKINENVINKFRFGEFDDIGIHCYHHGFNLGCCFNGGYDFMGCFDFFIDDFPCIKNNLGFLFPKKSIMKLYGIDDWDMYLRNKKITKLTSKFKKQV